MFASCKVYKIGTQSGYCGSSFFREEECLHIICDKFGTFCVEMAPVLKVVLVRREAGHKGNHRDRNLGDLQILQQSQVLQMRKQRDYFLKAT